jgi:hypothetical protein
VYGARSAADAGAAMLIATKPTVASKNFFIVSPSSSSLLFQCIKRTQKHLSA